MKVFATVNDTNTGEIKIEQMEPKITLKDLSISDLFAIVNMFQQSGLVSKKIHEGTSLEIKKRLNEITSSL